MPLSAKEELGGRVAKLEEQLTSVPHMTRPTAEWDSRVTTLEEKMKSVTLEMSTLKEKTLSIDANVSKILEILTIRWKRAQNQATNKCFECGATDHFKANCPKLRANHTVQLVKNEEEDVDAELFNEDLNAERSVMEA